MQAEVRKFFQKASQPVQVRNFNYEETKQEQYEKIVSCLDNVYKYLGSYAPLHVPHCLYSFVMHEGVSVESFLDDVAVLDAKCRKVKGFMHPLEDFWFEGAIMAVKMSYKIHPERWLAYGAFFAGIVNFYFGIIKRVPLGRRKKLLGLETLPPATVLPFDVPPLLTEAKDPLPALLPKKIKKEKK